MISNQSKKLDNQEKKYQAVYRQLYGKEKAENKISSSYALNFKTPIKTPEIAINLQENNFNYLSRDLFKILFLTIFVLFVQLLIYLEFKTSLAKNLLLKYLSI